MEKVSVGGGGRKAEGGREGAAGTNSLERRTWDRGRRRIIMMI